MRGAHDAERNGDSIYLCRAERNRGHCVQLLYGVRDNIA